MTRPPKIAAVCGFLLAASTTLEAYPLFDSEDTGIRRLEFARLAQDQAAEGRGRPPGELLRLSQVDLRMTSNPSLELPAPDARLSRELRGLLGGEADRYGVAVLDLSDPQAPRYAEHEADVARNPGSVGKILVAVGLFQALADAWPEDLEARARVLRETTVTADAVIVHDSHTVRLFDPQTRTSRRRPLQIGDQGSLWEFLDWMLSASSNAAASVVIQEAMLLRQFARDYPPAPAAAAAFISETPKRELATLLERTLQAPLTRNGIDLTRLRQGSFFTKTGKSRVPGTNSYATPREMIRLMLRIEQGRIVDEWSSRELKRLLYMTERRIRYASSPALADAAVYFKSGSLYRCEPEAGFTCRKYHGNVENLMNSVAVVESPASAPSLFYIVALTSNVLRRNSAVDHQTLATRIHRLLEREHGVAR